MDCVDVGTKVFGGCGLRECDDDLREIVTTSFSEYSNRNVCLSTTSPAGVRMTSICLCT